MAFLSPIGRILRHLRPYRWQVVGVVVLALFSDIAFFNLWPLSFKYLIEVRYNRAIMTLC